MRFFCNANIFQWFGAVLVFAGIFLDGVYGKQKPAQQKPVAPEDGYKSDKSNTD